MSLRKRLLGGGAVAGLAAAAAVAAPWVAAASTATPVTAGPAVVGTVPFHLGSLQCTLYTPAYTGGAAYVVCDELVLFNAAGVQCTLFPFTPGPLVYVACAGNGSAIAVGPDLLVATVLGHGVAYGSGHLSFL